jgi:hypothetical protein
MRGSYADGYEDACLAHEKDNPDDDTITVAWERSLSSYTAERADVAPTTAEVVAYLRTLTDEQLRAILVEYGGGS